jgi:hypothetical protein
MPIVFGRNVRKRGTERVAQFKENLQKIVSLVSFVSLVSLVCLVSRVSFVSLVHLVFGLGNRYESCK